MKPELRIYEPPDDDGSIDLVRDGLPCWPILLLLSLLAVLSVFAATL